jgi:hypothetical protein
MSYLDRIRIVFFGDFQADVSTVNNDVRHFDSSTFEARFQELSQGPDQNGWWRPSGSSAYRLIRCQVRAVHYGDGEVCMDPQLDCAAGALVGGSRDRVSGKIVDLDPQWQMSSQLWGVVVSLSDGAGNLLFRGRFEPSAFRDIVFGRQENAAVNGQSASAVFQSVLTDVAWGEVHASSRALTELRRVSSPGLLSIRLTTFGYYTRQDQERFTLGTVSGVIGPAYGDEPHSFLTGRRFAPANGSQTAEGLSFFGGRIDPSGATALVDLSNAVPLSDPFGAQKDLGSLDLAILRDETIAEGQTVDASQAAILGEMPYRSQEWLARSGGIFSAPLPEELKNSPVSKPLAILVRGVGRPTKVAIRETKNGLHLRAEQLVQRLDAGQAGTVDLFATQYGLPLRNNHISVSLLPPQSGMGGGRPEPNPPKAPIPTINQPAESLRFPDSVLTDDRGRATLLIETSDPGNPRGYIDGQIYLLRYSLGGAPDLVQHSFDFVIIHLRDRYEKIDQPTWLEHIQPILTQYGNLYPVMSERIVDLTSYESVAKERAILSLALSLEAEDPNHMPVSRDLSAGKRHAILHWLNEEDAPGHFVLRYGTAGVLSSGPTVRRLVAASPVASHEAGGELFPNDIGGKADFLRTLPARLRSRPSE